MKTIAQPVRWASRVKAKRTEGVSCEGEEMERSMRTSKALTRWMAFSR